MSTTLVKNGTVVTASDRYDADIYIDKGVITLIGQGLNIPADTVVDASGKLVMPGGIDVHTHLDMPFGGTTSADDFETGTIAAAHGGTTTLIDFAIQSFGEGLYPAFEGWMKKAEGQVGHRLRLPHDRARADRPGPARHGQDGPPRRRHLLQAVHGLPGRLHGGRRHDLQGPAAHARERRARLHARRERRGHRHPGEGGAAQGPDRAQVPRPDPPHPGRGRGHRPRHRPRRDGGVPIYIVHLSCSDALEKVKQARDMGLPAYAETCPQYLFLSYDDYERPGFEGAKYVMSPPLREKWNQDALWKGLAEERPPGGLHRPLPVLHERGGPEAPGQGRLLEDPERRAGHRDPAHAALGRRRAHGPHRRAPLRGARVHEPREDVRPLAEEGHGRGRLRRGPRALRSREGDAPSRRRPTT